MPAPENWNSRDKIPCPGRFSGDCGLSPGSLLFCRSSDSRFGRTWFFSQAAPSQVSPVTGFRHAARLSRSQRRYRSGFTPDFLVQLPRTWKVPQWQPQKFFFHFSIRENPGKYTTFFPFCKGIGFPPFPGAPPNIFRPAHSLPDWKPAGKGLPCFFPLPVLQHATGLVRQVAASLVRKPLGEVPHSLLSAAPSALRPVVCVYLL